MEIIQIIFLSSIILLLASLGWSLFQNRRLKTEFDQQKKQWSIEKDLELTKHNQNLSTKNQVLETERDNLKNQAQVFEKKLADQFTEIIRLSEDVSRYQAQLKAQESLKQEQLSFLEISKAKLLEQFKSLSLDSLNQNSETFLSLAKNSFEKLSEVNLKIMDHQKSQVKDTVIPINETLSKFESKLSELEKNRVESFAQLFSHFSHLKESQDKLRSETSNLVKALRTPHVRGRWGELQLKRVVEIAGMLEHCDFYQQESIDTDEGRLRPDLVVRLPGEKTIVVDSKAVLLAYLEAAQSEDEVRKKELLIQHADHIRVRIQELSKKSYWEQFESSPEFVVLFLPGESFFSSALEVSPTLIEEGVSEKVILATPTTLIALLKAVSYGWKQASLTENARQISELGKELYKRLNDMTGHFQKLGQQLGLSVESYNRTMASLESRVLVSARRFKELKSIDGSQDIETLSSIEKIPKQASVLMLETELDGESIASKDIETVIQDVVENGPIQTSNTDVEISDSDKKRKKRKKAPQTEELSGTDQSS